jgi:hypothetical protein
MQGDPETGGPMGQDFFVYCLRVEMSFRCRQALPGKKCLLDLLQSVLQFQTRCLLKGACIRWDFYDIFSPLEQTVLAPLIPGRKEKQCKK